MTGLHRREYASANAEYSAASSGVAYKRSYFLRGSSAGLTNVSVHGPMSCTWTSVYFFVYA
jgi:hypothetical protein